MATSVFDAILYYCHLWCHTTWNSCQYFDTQPFAKRPQCVKNKQCFYFHDNPATLLQLGLAARQKERSECKQERRSQMDADSPSSPGCLWLAVCSWGFGFFFPLSRVTMATWIQYRFLSPADVSLLENCSHRLTSQGWVQQRAAIRELKPMILLPFTAKPLSQMLLLHSPPLYVTELKDSIWGVKDFVTHTVILK